MNSSGFIIFLSAFFLRQPESFYCRVPYTSYNHMHPLLWNAKLTETQILREFSIEIESSLFTFVIKGFSILIIEL